VSAHLYVGEAVPAAPAAVGLALAVAGLLAFTAFLVASGMLKLYAETLGAFIRWLASKIDVDLHIPHFGGHPFRAVSHGLYAVDDQIRNAFAAAALRSESAASWCFSTAGNTIVWMARETADLAHDVWSALQHTTVATIPAAIRRAEAATLARLRALDHSIARVATRAQAQVRRLEHVVDGLTGRIEHRIPQALSRINSRLDRLLRDGRGLRARVHEIEKLLTVAGATGLVALALRRLGLNWLRCPSLLRMGRRIGCGGFAFAESLMALSFAPLLLQDACALVRQYERLAVAIQPALADFVLGVEGWVCGGPNSLPSGTVAGDLKRVAKMPTGL
jgi:hypothetical protein